MSPVEVIFSEKVRSMSITSPVVYELLALSEVMLVMVGRVVSIVKPVMLKALEAFPVVSVTVMVQSV